MIALHSLRDCLRFSVASVRVLVKSARHNASRALALDHSGWLNRLISAAKAGMPAQP